MLPPRDGVELAYCWLIPSSSVPPLSTSYWEGPIQVDYPAEEARSLMYATTCSFCQHVTSAQALHLGQENKGAQNQPPAPGKFTIQGLIPSINIHDEGPAMIHACAHGTRGACQKLANETGSHSCCLKVKETVIKKMNQYIYTDVSYMSNSGI